MHLSERGGFALGGSLYDRIGMMACNKYSRIASSLARLLSVRLRKHLTKLEANKDDKVDRSPLNRK